MKLSRKHVAQETLPTSNREWGFFGTLLRQGIYEETVARAFASKSKQLIAAGLAPEQARDVLDATYGRHLADYYTDLIAAAIDSALSQPIPQGSMRQLIQQGKRL